MDIAWKRTINSQYVTDDGLIREHRALLRSFEVQFADPRNRPDRRRQTLKYPPRTGRWTTYRGGTKLEQRYVTWPTAKRGPDGLPTELLEMLDRSRRPRHTGNLIGYDRPVWRGQDPPQHLKDATIMVLTQEDIWLGVW